MIQWFRSAIPSNSLACLYGLALECGQQKTLGDDVELEIHAFDETNTIIRPDKIAGLIKDAGDGMVMLVGVQSNQFPRALDIARPLREQGIKVGIGGFHVSGHDVDAQGPRPAGASGARYGHFPFCGRGRGAARAGFAWMQ